MKPIGVVLADDHAVLREGLAALIGGQEGMCVYAQARDGIEAVAACKATQPDVALVDLSMPKLGGIEAIAQIHQVSPGTRVVVLTMHDNPRYLRSALAAGAAGYVVKELVSREIFEAIRAVYGGQLFIRMSLASEQAGAATDSRLESPRPVPHATLSHRERQVLRLIALGYTNQEAADSLSVGKKSIDSYRARIQQKLGLSRRSDIVRYALETGVLSRDSDDDV